MANISDIISKLGEIGGKVGTYVTALATLASAIVQLAQTGGEAIDTLKGYFDEIVSAFEGLYDKVIGTVESSQDEFNSVLDKLDSLFAKAMELIHKMGLMSDDTYAGYLSEFSSLISESEKLDDVQGELELKDSLD